MKSGILWVIAPLIAIAVDCGGVGAARAGPKIDPDIFCARVRPTAAFRWRPVSKQIGTFTGQAVGWGAGTFSGDTNTGFRCSGHWTTSNWFGAGEAVIECDDGETGIACFTSQDLQTGTATGSGLTSSGLSIQSWSGHQLQQFVINDSGDFDAGLMCGDVSVPVS